MNVYVETNFILELAFLQEQLEPARDKIEAVLPPLQYAAAPAAK